MHISVLPVVQLQMCSTALLSYYFGARNFIKSRCCAPPLKFLQACHVYCCFVVLPVLHSMYCLCLTVLLH